MIFLEVLFWTTWRFLVFFFCLMICLQIKRGATWFFKVALLKSRMPPACSSAEQHATRHVLLQSNIPPAMLSFCRSTCCPGCSSSADFSYLHVFYGPDAANFGDRMRFWVRARVWYKSFPSVFHGQLRAHRAPRTTRFFTRCLIRMVSVAIFADKSWSGWLAANTALYVEKYINI